MKKEPLNLRVNPILCEILDILAYQEDKTKSQLVAEILEEYFKNNNCEVSLNV